MTIPFPQAGDTNWAGDGGTSGTKLNDTLEALDARITTEKNSLASTIVLLDSAMDAADAALDARVDLLENPPRAMLRQTTIQAIPNASFNPVDFEAEDWDTHNGHSTSSSIFTWTCPVAGTYQLSGGVSMVNNATGVRGSVWLKNGAHVNGSQVIVNPTGGGVSTILAAKTIDVELEVGDTVRLGAYQSSGGALNSAVNTSEQSYMCIRYVGPLAP